jgi:ssDNA-binding replication factor A large subunit
MGDVNYEKVLDKIADSSGLGREEIDRRIEAKIAKLSGLISKEGAAQVIAAELGISFDNEKLKINELLSGMRKVNVVGQIINLFPVRNFTTKKGEEGKVVNFTIADDTSNIKVVLWDASHIELIEKGEISEGKVIEILNGSMRANEIHLGSFSEFKLSDEVLNDLKKEKVVNSKDISSFNLGDNASVRAFIVQAFDPRFFNVCPECKKKVVSGEEGFICVEHQKVVPEKRALINIVIDDGTESIRSVLFNDALPSLGITELDDVEKLSNQKQDLLGKEMVFSGNIRMNKFFNNSEFIINEVKDINLDGLIEGLEKKV